MKWLRPAWGMLQSIEANRTGKLFLKKTFVGFKVFKRILMFLGHCVLRYEGARLPECNENVCNNPPHLR